MPYLYEQFVENSKNTSIDKLKDVIHLGNIINELHKSSMSLNNEFSDEELNDINALKDNFRKVYNFLTPMEDKESYYSKKSGEWKDITAAAKGINELLNKDSVISLLQNNASGELDESFIKGINKLNEIGGFEIKTDNLSEAITDPEVHKEKVRLRKMSPDELGELKRKHETKLKEANSAREAADQIASDAKDILKYYEKAKTFEDGTLNNWINKHGKKYRESLNNLTNIGKNLQIEESFKVMDKDNTMTIKTESRETSEYTPSDILYVTKKTKNLWNKHYEKQLLKLENKFIDLPLMNEVLDFIDVLYDKNEFLEEAVDKFAKMTKKMPKGKDIENTISEEEKEIEIINNVIEGKGLSPKAIDASIREKYVNAAKESLGKVITKAEETNKKVFNGSRQFDNALLAIKEYSEELNKYNEMKNDPSISNVDRLIATDEIQKKSNKAKVLISQYFERKNKELWNNAKSKERMGLMNDALEAIEAADREIAADKEVTKHEEAEREQIERKERERKRKEREEKRKAEIEERRLKEAKEAEKKAKVQEREAFIREHRNTLKPSDHPDFKGMMDNTVKDRIKAYKAESEQYRKLREESDLNAANNNSRIYGTAWENSALVAAESIEALSKIADSEQPLTPKQKKEAVKHIAMVYAHETAMVFSRDKNISKQEFKQGIRPLAESKVFIEKIGEITPQSLREFIREPKKIAQITEALAPENVREQLRKEALANKKRLNEITAKKAELKIKNEAFDMKRPNVPSLGDEHAAIKKTKPKAMGK